MIAHLCPVHETLIRAAGCAHGDNCGTLTRHKRQHFFHVTLPNGQQAEILIQGYISERPVASCGVYSNISRVAVEHPN